MEFLEIPFRPVLAILFIYCNCQIKMCLTWNNLNTFSVNLPKHVLAQILLSLRSDNRKVDKDCGTRSLTATRFPGPVLVRHRPWNLHFNDEPDFTHVEMVSLSETESHISGVQPIWKAHWVVIGNPTVHRERLNDHLTNPWPDLLIPNALGPKMWVPEHADMWASKSNLFQTDLQTALASKAGLLLVLPLQSKYLQVL